MEGLNCDMDARNGVLNMLSNDAMVVGASIFGRIERTV